LVYTTHSRYGAFNAMSDAVIIYLTNFEKGVMRAWVNPQAMDIPSMFRRETVNESNPERIGYFCFIGPVQKGV